ncbi:MAG: hypothetical protein MRZ34_04935 [Bacillales bacterium]|nr:hypothetical protein [Bacillales bacterium]
MKKKECIDLLLKIINDIRNENYAIEFINGGYSYSKEITTISKILDTSYFQNVLDENYSTYKISGKNLNNIEDISSFSLMECIVYLNWLWHIDGSGILTGIIYTKIKNGKYILLLERIKDCIESDNLINIGEL